MIEDRELAEEIIKKTDKLRRLNQAVGNRRIRLAIDGCLTIVYLLAKDGHLRNMRGGIEAHNKVVDDAADVE